MKKISKKLVLILSIAPIFLIVGCNNRDQPMDYDNPRIEHFITFSENTTKILESDSELQHTEEFILHIADNRAQTISFIGPERLAATRVDEISNGELRTVFTTIGLIPEDITSLEGAHGTIATVLQEPLEIGHSWQVGDGSGAISTITNMTEQIETPFRTFNNVMVVSTELPNGDFAISHFARGYGLIKDVFFSGAGEITIDDIDFSVNEHQGISILSAVNRNNPHDFLVHVFTEETPEPTIVSVPISTGHDFVQMFNNLLKEHNILQPDVYVTAIDIDRSTWVANVDFSDNLLDDISGSSMEINMLQSLTDTFGAFYTVLGLVPTIGGELYESGHFIIDTSNPMVISWMQ